MEIKYVYGFDPGYALSNGIKPYIIKIPFKYISEDGRCWVDPGPNIECLRYTIPAQPQWFAPGQYSFDLDEAKEMLNDYLKEYDRKQSLSDEEWVEEDMREYLSRYFNKDIVDKYIDKIKELTPNLWHTYIDIRDNKAYYTIKEDWISQPLKPERYSNYRETKAEKEERLKRQMEEHEKYFKINYREVIIC